MNIAAICGFCIISTVVIVLTKRLNSELAPAVSCISAGMILVYIISNSSEIFNGIYDIALKTGIDNESIRLMFKALGICYITQLTKDVCADCGVSSLALKVDLAGKLAVALLAFPLLLQVLNIIARLMGQG